MRLLGFGLSCGLWLQPCASFSRGGTGPDYSAAPRPCDCRPEAPHCADSCVPRPSSVVDSGAHLHVLLLPLRHILLIFEKLSIYTFYSFYTHHNHNLLLYLVILPRLKQLRLAAVATTPTKVQIPQIGDYRSGNARGSLQVGEAKITTTITPSDHEDPEGRHATFSTQTVSSSSCCYCYTARSTTISWDPTRTSAQTMTRAEPASCALQQVVGEPLTEEKKRTL